MGEKERAQYPWQIAIASRFAVSELSEAMRRRRECEFFYQFELVLLEEGLGSELVYDGERDVCSAYADGRFALSREREHADWAGLKAMGYFEAWRL